MQLNITFTIQPLFFTYVKTKSRTSRWTQEREVFICCYCYWNCEEVSHLQCLSLRISTLNIEHIIYNIKGWVYKNTRKYEYWKKMRCFIWIIYLRRNTFHDIFPTFYSYYGWKEQSRLPFNSNSSSHSCNNATNS